MTIQNITIGNKEEPKKKRGRKPGLKNKINIVEKNVEVNYSNEFLDYLDGNNSGENQPMDDFLNGKKIVWKKKWLVWMTNHNKHGKIMSDEEAFNSSETASDNFFSSAYREPEFICRNKKTQIVEFQESNFQEFCDYVNRLN